MLSEGSPNWHGLKTFEVGRPKGFRKAPVKRALLLLAAVGYLAFGVLLWLGLKVFSKDRRLFGFLNVVLMWPRAVAVLLNGLKHTGVVAKLINQ